MHSNINQDKTALLAILIIFLKRRSWECERAAESCKLSASYTSFQLSPPSGVFCSKPIPPDLNSTEKEMFPTFCK